MNVNLRQIRAFVAVARLGSFTRAAEALHLTQPALTVQIRGLEEVLEARLFDRTTRSVTLTRVGLTLLPAFERMIGDLESVIDEARDIAAMKRGVVRIAVLPSVAAAILPRAISSFRDRHPGAAFIVHDLVADRVIEKLRDGSADMGITGGEVIPPDMRLIFRKRDDFNAIVPRSHPLAARATLTRDDILAHPLVALHPATSVRRVVDDWFHAASRMPTIACEATYMTTVAGMVSAGLGLALLPSSAREVLAFPELVRIPISGPPLTREISVVTLAGRSLFPMSEAFCAHLTAELARYPEAG